jgi:hypothetical protein
LSAAEVSAPRGDIRPLDVVVACAIALIVHVAAAWAISSSALEKMAALPEIDRGTATPVKVVPVLDLDSPLLKLGGKPTKAKLPDRWLKQAPKARVEERTFVSPKASKTIDAIPSKDVPMADAGTPAPPPTAEIAKVVDTPVVPEVEPRPAPNVAVEGHADGVKEGTETDPLKARAVDLYRARIAAWFSGRFRVTGSGLPQEELLRYRVPAQVQLSADRRVESFTISPSGNAVFDAAARATLERTRGESIPPPPENYPDTIQRHISLTFVCKEHRCD